MRLSTSRLPILSRMRTASHRVSGSLSDASSSRIEIRPPMLIRPTAA